ncbi:2-dehydro-3-deoxygalactonokinase [uncultured Nisaea sp.]|uniref:2-dehydro-3-deoxygalactonokinase n=1 Tax=uncultured Nisaea sp. TaxID=538215 RepID=UPI0030EBCCC5|tara:strand:- start:15067 stop:15984 length:918 start_codon:yes stop_codon:yes gene_type:complete
MSDTAVLALDWGTTRLRAFRMAEDGAILERRDAPAGIRAIDDGDFEDAFQTIVGDWLPPAGETRPLIVLGGMIGSRQGWFEAPYVPCPADPESLVSHAIAARTESGHALWIAPGLSLSEGGRADVMRGEELQIFGALEQLGPGRHLLCLPGTHSKWALLEDGIIRDFHTYMTGELFDVLRRHSILGTTIEHAVWSDAGFEKGLTAARSDAGLLAHLFTVRAGTLLETLPVEESGSFLSGLLIGSEVASATRDLAEKSEVCIIGNPDLTDLYTPAIARHGIRCRQLGEYTGAHGLFRLATGLRKRL